MNEISVDTSWTTKMAFLIVVTILIRTVSSIGDPNNFLEDVEKFERIKRGDNDAGNRSLIIAETMKRYKQNRLFSRSIPCISSLLHNRSISFWYSASMIPSIFDHGERQTPVEVDLLVRTLQVETATYMVNDVHAIYYKNFASTAIIVIEDYLDIERMNSSHFIKMCTFDCEFVVVIAKVFDNEKAFLSVANRVGKFMWFQFVARLVTLGTTRESVLLAGSRTFQPKGWCKPDKPILLGSCRTSSTSTVDKSTVWKLDVEPIDGRDFSMNGCTLPVGMYENKPYVFSIKGAHGRIFKGLEYFIIVEIIHNLNGKIVEIRRSDLGESSIDGMNVVKFRAKIFGSKNKFFRVNLIIGGLTWNPRKGTDYTIAYNMVPIVWVSPVMANFSLRGLISPFSTFVWGLTLCMILLGILIMLIFVKDISILDIFALIIGTSVYRQPTIPSTRMLFLCWSLFGFFMSQYYLASLADQLVNTSNFEIDTMEELLASGLKFGGTAHYAKLFNETNKKNEDGYENLVNRRIHERFRVFRDKDYVLRLRNLLYGKDKSIALVAKSSAFYNVGTLSKQYAHILKDNIENHPIAIATWEGFPCLRKFNRKIRQLIEGGFIQFWIQSVTQEEVHRSMKSMTTSDNNIHLENLLPVFLILIIGYLAGFCVLIIEIVAYPSKWLA